MRRFLTAVSVLGLVGVLFVAAVALGSGAAQGPGRPTIAKPATVPAQPQAGKPFTVAFKVTNARTGMALTAGKMMCDPSIAGKVIRHAESFRGGVARLSFVIPANAAGRLLNVKLTITAAKRSATKVMTYRVMAAAMPSISVADSSAVEGNSGTTVLSFAVTLSAAATQAVSVGYSTADGTAAAPSDYGAATGTLTLQPGETSKAITVNVVPDTVTEPNETFTLTLANPVNATLGTATATGTITNDDTGVPVTPGTYLDNHGNWVYLTVLPDRTVTGFRTNSLSESCQPGNIYLRGGVDWGTHTFPIAADGSFTATGSWSGSDKRDDLEWTSESWQVSGVFDTPTSVTGTFTLGHELSRGDTHYRCSTGTLRFSAVLQK